MGGGGVWAEASGGHTHVLVLIEDSRAPLGLSVVPEGHFPGSLKIKWE